jgi:hypothetical protein
MRCDVSAPLQNFWDMQECERTHTDAGEMKMARK